jgi:hypothetical protein
MDLLDIVTAIGAIAVVFFALRFPLEKNTDNNQRQCPETKK